MGRPPVPVIVRHLPRLLRLDPFPPRRRNPVVLEPAEVEALRLAEIEKLPFEEIGKRMGVSRNTAWRLVDSAREKIARALVEERGILILRETDKIFSNEASQKKL